MTIKELINELKQFSPDREVYFSFPAEDYWGNHKVQEVSSVEEVEVHYSCYHESLVETKENQESEKQVIIIN
jgi:hypothetical protein